MSQTITRRALLAGVSLSALAGVPAVAATSGTFSGSSKPDPHPAIVEAMERRMVRECKLYNAMERHYGICFDGEQTAVARRWNEFRGRLDDRNCEDMQLIIDTPARTAAGMLAKNFLLWKEAHCGKSDFGEDLADSLTADLVRLAGLPENPWKRWKSPYVRRGGAS